MATLIFLAIAVPPCSLSAAEESAGKQWALLIGVEGYQKAGPLQYTVNDVRQLATTLQTHGGYDEEHILQISDDGAEPAEQPYKASIEKLLPEFLKKPGEQDSMVVYFSGHGFRDAEGRLYLAPIDVDPDNSTATGVSVEWFRDQLAACRAQFKLLILDACHAGSEKADVETQSVTAKDLGDLFKASPGVITLASSTAEEKSLIWDFKQQSLFSYWLKEGLKGHADANGDGAVSVDELYDFVHGHVTKTARVRFTRPQTPVRLVGPRTPGVPLVVRLQPQGLKQTLSDMAEQMAGVMEERGLGNIGVLEFTNDTKLGELLGANFGLLGRYCAEELERRMVDRCGGKFTVVDRGRLQAALKEQRLGLKDLSSGSALEQLSKRAGGMPVVARGTLIDRHGRMVTLRCKLIETEGDATLASVGGLAQLNESEWAMIGRSAEIAPEARRGDPPTAVEPARPTEDRVVEHADEASRGPHPLQDPDFKYPIKLMIGSKERRGVFKKMGEGKDEHWEYFVPVRTGEIYELWVGNRSGGPVMMRLLVDGLNTLPEKEQLKGVETYVWGKRVNLNEARSWLLDPTSRNTLRIAGVPTYAIRGFVTDTGSGGKLREFTVVDADKSLAARQEFTDQIGIVTAAFYSASTSRGVGTAAGQERNENIEERGGYVAGNLLAVVHIRYVDEAALADER